MGERWNMKKDTKIMLVTVLGICVYIILLLGFNPFSRMLKIDFQLSNSFVSYLYFGIYQVVIIAISILFSICQYRKDELGLKHVIGGMLVLILYFTWNTFAYVPLQLLGVDVAHMSIFMKTIYLLWAEILIIFLIIFLFRDQLKVMFLDLKKNHQTYFKKYFKYWFLILGVMYASNFIIMIMNHGEIANNEQAVRDTFQVAPVYTFISAVFLAPVIEELAFRQAIRNVCQTKWLFILISGIVFGGMHVFSMAEVWTDYLYLIPYCTPGIIFAYLLTKTDNVLIPMAIHFTHNGILMSLQVLLFLLS